MLETARMMPEPAERRRITFDDLVDDFIQDLEDRYEYLLPLYV